MIAMRTTFPMLASLVLAFAACEPATTSTNPDDALERIDSTTTPSDPGTDEAAAGPVAKGKTTPKVRDRDPEEEKKKLALSHQRSAEAQRMLASGRFTEALDHSRQALKIHEQNVAAMLVMGEVYYKQKKFELVQAVTSTALAVDAKIRTPQESSHAHNLKGFAYAAMGNDNLATQAFRMAAEADDKNAAAWNNLGTRYMQAGDVATAKSCFTYALELDPRFAKAHVNLGAALRGEGKWQDAEKSLLTALKLRPNYPEAYFNLGVLYLDADPYPGLETVPRLEKSIGFLTKYRDLAIADGPDGPGNAAARSGPKVKPGPAPVSKARADDYIRVAKKGIDREQRRIDREKGRDPKKAGEPAKPGGASTPADAATPADAGAVDATATPSDGVAKPGAPAKPGAASPTAPAKTTPQSPGAATKPGATPPAAPPPAPAKPGAAPTTPSDPPASKPAPVQPSAPKQPSTPVQPSKPSTTPPAGKPAPVQPSTKPAAPPAPSQPSTPPAAPQKPSVQKPGAKSARACSSRCDPRFAPAVREVDAAVDEDRYAAWNTRRRVDTHCPALPPGRLASSTCSHHEPSSPAASRAAGRSQGAIRSRARRHIDAGGAA